MLNGKKKTYAELKKETEQYEDLVSQEITATKEEDDFQWLLSETEPKEAPPKVVDLGERRRDKNKLEGPFWDDGKSVASPKLPIIKRKKKRIFDFRKLPFGVIGVVLSAIIVGVSFGVMMLTIFTGDKGEITGGADVVQAPPPPVDTGAAVTSNSHVPTLAVEVVQGGAFSLVGKGHETVQALREQGYAAALTNTTDPVYLFIGLGLNKEQATAIAEKYKANGQEIYLKPYAISTTSTVENDDQALFLQKSIELFEQLALLSANGFANDGSLFTNETLSKLKNMYNELIVIDNIFSENQEQESLSLAFQESLANAYQNMDDFVSSNDQAMLWQVQQDLLNGLISYEELIKTF